MEREISVRILEVPGRVKVYGAFAIGLLVGVLCMALFIQSLDAASGTLDPDGNGNTSQGTRTTCATANNFDCVNDGTRQPSSPSTTGDYITWSRDQFDSYQLSTLSNVNTATTVQIHVYHIDLKNNMQLEVELWNAAETTQIGSSVILTQRLTSAWDTATFSGLTLTQTDLDGLRVRLTCLRTGGGGPDQCRAFSVYATVGYTENINVTVSATGSQQDVNVGTNNQYIGGVFAITENTSSRNITSVTISEAGTVDAQTNLSNVRLFYELDSTGPSYDCADQTYNGTENQYGATTTFNGSNGTATFSQSVGITTTAALCLYVVVDVGSGAAPNETIEVQITNPTTDVVGSPSPVISPATAVLLPNTTTLLKQNLTQIHYHWRSDDGSETTASSATGAEDISYDNLARSVTQRLRLEVSNEGNTTSAGTQYRLEYRMKGLTCATSTGWVDVGAVGGDWDMAGSASQLIEGNDTTNISTTTGGVTDENSTFVGTGGQRETSSQTSSISLASTEFYEMEFAVVANGSASDGTTYCFRVSNAGTPIDTYSIYPEATIAADLLVTSFGSQTSFVNIPSTSVYTGGGFSITDSSAGTHSINQIVLTASGTVDYQNDIENVVLWYETDVSSPFNCTGESFNGDETQYGATSTNGFPSGTATFSGSVSVTPTQGVCLYVQYDVSGDASNGETFEVFFTNPSTDITIDTGSVSPSSLVDITGFTTFAEAIPVQQHYHWRNDDGDEIAATSATGAEDTPLSDFEDGIRKRLRFGISNEGATSTGPYNYRLEWAQKISSCAAATGWTDVGATADEWNMSLSPNFTDGTDTTNISTTTGGVSDEATTFVTPNGGMKESSSQTGAITLLGDEFVEVEYSIIGSSSVSPGATYCFRVTNAGTPLSSYTNYAEVEIKLPTDFNVQRGITNVTGTSATITAGVEYTAPASTTRTFIRITNTHMTGSGPSAGTAGNSNASDVTVHISNPANIGTSVTFTRAGTTGDTMVAWEIVEYVGAPNGENEFIVRDQSTATYGTGNTTVTTGTVGGIQDDNDVVVFITGQSNPDGGRFDFNTGLSTSAWNAGADTATFTRGESGADASIVSYAVVEFTGSNWIVQRTNDHTYSQVGVTETETITSVGSLSRAFIHAQHRAGSGQDQHSDFGHEAWLSGSNQVSFRLSGTAQTASSHVSAAWVIENLQSSGDVMEVHRTNGTITSGGGGLTTANINIGTTVADLGATSIFSNNSNSDTGRSFPESMIRARLISVTQYEFAISDDLGDNIYRTEVVEWPTADPILTQNNYQFYATTTALDPTDRWPVGGTDIGENAEVTGFDEPIASGEWFRLRMSLQVSGAALVAGSNAFKLQYGARPGDTCTAVSAWHNLGAIGSTTAVWRGYNTPLADGTALSTDPPAVGALNLSDSDVAGTFEEENDTALTPYLVLPGEDIEFDWAVENNGATDKTSYCFRMVYADGSELQGGYNTHPTMRTVGFGVESQDWIWYDDEQNLTPTTTLAATNTAPIDIDFDNTIVLRTTLTEFNGANGVGAKFKLQFSESSTFATSTDVAEIGNCDELSYWCYDDGAGVDNATITAKTLTDADACSGGVGAGCGSYNESGTTISSFVHQKNASAEYSFTIRQSGARVNVVYYFRVYDVLNDEVVPLASGESYPSLVTKGASLVSTMEGISSSTIVEGVTLDIDTTPTTIPFGSVPAAILWEGAHRLTVDTNGTEGYKILMRMDGDLQSSFGAIIQPITGTNLSPTPWNTGCQVSAASCFGYHTSDDTLEAVPQTRFSALDTYARVSTTTLEEIAFSSQPVINEFTDIVYRIYRTELQDAGLYEANIIYIIVPIF